MSEQASLWDLTTGSGALGGRFVSDEAARFSLDRLAGGTTLGAPLEAFAGRNVVIRTGGQLATALALLELDGVAGRIVLCPADLSPGELRRAMATADASILLGDGAAPCPLEGGVACIASTSPAVRPAAPAEVGRLDTEWALFTSGTTGPPKLAIHTRRTLTAPMTHGAATPGGGVWSTFYDIRRYGGLQILLRALTGGGSMVLSGAHEAGAHEAGAHEAGAHEAGAHEAPDAFLARAGAAGITFLSGTPTHWRRALLSPAAAAIAPRHVRLSGEVADQAVLDRLRAAYPDAQIRHAFAATEAGVAFEVADGAAGFPASWIGTCRDGVDLRIVEGTLRVRSPRTARRYLGDDGPKLVGDEGFVDTRDLVGVQGDRCLFIGRRDGVINVGGHKVHPEEVEAVINGLACVEMSRVSARRSPITGAVVVADVVLRAGEGEAGALQSDILGACRAALAAYKVPALIRFVAALDVSAAGKLLRPAA